MDCQMTYPPSTIPKDHPSISTKSLPTLPSGNPQTLTSRVAISRPSSVLNMSFLTKPNVRRDSSLSDKPNNLPFASAAFAELHRRRASSAKATTRVVSPEPPLPLGKPALLPLPPTPPPLPPKPETLRLPDGSPMQTASISTPSAVVTSFSGFDIDATAAAASWLSSSSSASPPISTNRESSRVSVLTKSVKSKMLKRMTISTVPMKRPYSHQQHRKSKIDTSTRRIAHLISRKRSTLGFPYMDAKPNDEEADLFSDSDHDGDHENNQPALYVNSPTAADADDESEAIVHYAEKATFRRPVVVQCQPGARKVAIQDVLMTGPPPPLPLELGLCGRPTGLAELGQDLSGVNLQAEADAGGDGDVESEGFDAEAEERLEQRLAEDRSLEQKMVDRSGMVATAERGAEEQPWSDFIFTDSISNHHLPRRTEKADDKEGAKKRIRRRGSAMSELDELVRESLFFAHESIDNDDEIGCDGDMPVPSDMLRGGAQKRKVSFSRPPNVDVALARKQVAWLRLGTPYPLFDEERSTRAEEALYDVEDMMEVTAPEQWGVSRSGARRSSVEGDKARKVLGLMEADEMIGLD